MIETISDLMIRLDFIGNFLFIIVFCTFIISIESAARPGMAVCISFSLI